MKTAVRYYTKSGNTQKLAIAIADAIGAEAKDVSKPLTERADILFLGSSVYAAGVDENVKKFIADNSQKIGKIVSFSTAALLSSTHGQIKKLGARYGVDVSDDEFHCRGAFSVLHRGRPNEEDLKAAAEFAERVLNKK